MNLFMEPELFRLQGEKVMQELILRDYQRDAFTRLRDALERHRRTLGIIATGCGKTEIFIELIRQTSQRGALVIIPRDPLVWQTADRLRKRGIKCGVELGRMRSDEKVTVACYNSLLSRKRFERYIGTIDLIVVDEVHTNFSKRSLEMLDSLTQGGVRLLGLTASPDRAKGDPLTSYYGDIGYYYPIQQATDDGWLVPAKVWLSIVEELDELARLKTPKFGDFDQEELGRIMAQEAVVQRVASLIEQHWEGQPSVVFCASIRQTELLMDVLKRRGLDAVMVHSEMDAMERKIHLQDFEEGRVNIIVNVGVLTLGWDSPRIRKVFLAKPTKSKSVYVQQYGRGTRPLAGVVDNHLDSASRRAAIAASGKPTFEIFDLTDSSRHNDLVTAIDALRPDLEPALLQRAKRRLAAAAGTTNIDAVVEAARAEAAAEAEARDRLEWHKRDGIIVDSGFGNYERDVMQAAEAPPKYKGWHMLFGKKYRGKPLKVVPSDYLAWVLTSECRNAAFLAAVRRELERRRDPH